MAADKLALLTRGLDDAAVALHGDLTDDAARQHAWSLLGSNAQEALRALCAAGEAPAVSTVATEPAASTRQRTARCGLERFPEDALGAIIAFVDLPMRFTCVVASRTLRDACMRLSPRLEYELVLKRFPLLTALPIRTSLAGVPAPRELFRSYRGRFNGRIFRAPQPNPTISLDAYTLALELRMREAEGPWESVYVGSGAITRLVATSTRIGASFTIPEGLYERALGQPHVRCSANVMVSRRSRSGRLQFARLFDGLVEENTGLGFRFDVDDVPYASDNTALNFIRFRADRTDNWTDPTFQLYWQAADLPQVNVPALEPGTFQRPRGPSFLFASFKWSTAEDDENMVERDIANCLEHYVDWSE